MRYFATNRDMHNLGKAAEAENSELRFTLSRHGYYFVDMDKYMRYYLGTVEQKEIPSAAIVPDSGSEVFSSFLDDERIGSIVVCVHGFNVKLHEAHTWFRVLTDTMKSVQGRGTRIVTSPESLPAGTANNLTAFVGFSWPSDGQFYRYRSDQRDAIGAAAPFAALISRLKTTGKRVNLLCHSMGNYLACHALAGMLSEQFGKHHDEVDAGRGCTDPPIDTYVMVAPDVERRHVTKCEPDDPEEDIETKYIGPFYSGLRHLARRVVNVYSRFDNALKASDIEKKPRDLFYRITESPEAPTDRRWEKRLGSAPAPHSAPDNFESVNATEVADRKIGHSDHIDSRSIVQRIAIELKI